MPKRFDSAPDLQELNTTELFHMASRLGIQGATLAVPRSLLIEAIKNLDHVPMQNPTEIERKRCSDFWVSKWDVVQMQMQKPHCPNCHLQNGMPLINRIDGRKLESFCSDMEFVDCYLDNKHRIV
jgi:hypothetical protein